ncbi:MAG: DAK2 domain-containing protein [Tuberibacillus sp.]
MLEKGSDNLTAQSSMINALNVFPVPDGDTGTNMSLTMQSGIKQIRTVKPETVGQAITAFSKGLLMGARGNSGVILSQLFRGMGRTLEQVDDGFNGKTLADALQSGVDTAYKAVMKPVEGTILTVAREAAKAAQKKAKKSESPIDVLEAALREAETALAKTPQLLPLLKEAGVVDSGGKGLVTIYEGFLGALKGEAVQIHDAHIVSTDMSLSEMGHNAHAVMKTEDIRYGYCTEFIVRFNESGKRRFDSLSFKERLARDGDSLLVASDDELLKVHVHTEKPGDMISLAQTYGELVTIKVENMREQHRKLVGEESGQQAADHHEEDHAPVPSIGVVTVAAGSGMEALFKSIGATTVIQGGQTMNPSTEDLLKAIKQTRAQKVLLLPNNSNIVMAAKQAADVAELPVAVVETQNIPQGLSALLVFNPDADLNENVKAMNDAMSHVKAGQVTHAVRDTTVDGVEITKGHYIGIYDKKIVVSHEDRKVALQTLVNTMLDDDDEILTLISGENVEMEEAEALADTLQDMHDHIEVEIHEGGQPVYDYVIAIE